MCLLNQATCYKPTTMIKWATQCSCQKSQNPRSHLLNIAQGIRFFFFFFFSQLVFIAHINPLYKCAALACKSQTASVCHSDCDWWHSYLSEWMKRGFSWEKKIHWCFCDFAWKKRHGDALICGRCPSFLSSMLIWVPSNSVFAQSSPICTLSGSPPARGFGRSWLVTELGLFLLCFISMHILLMVMFYPVGQALFGLGISSSSLCLFYGFMAWVFKQVIMFHNTYTP